MIFHLTEKYFTSSEFDNLASRLFTAKLGQANLVTKTDFDDKLKYLSQKITSNKTKNLAAENELKKPQTFDSIFLKAKVILKKMVHKIV